MTEKITMSAEHAARVIDLIEEYLTQGGSGNDDKLLTEARNIIVDADVILMEKPEPVKPEPAPKQPEITLWREEGIIMMSSRDPYVDDQADKYTYAITRANIVAADVGLNIIRNILADAGVKVVLL